MTASASPSKRKPFRARWIFGILCLAVCAAAAVYWHLATLREHNIGGEGLMQWNEGTEPPKAKSERALTKVVEEMKRDGWELVFASDDHPTDYRLFTLDDGSNPTWIFDPQRQEWNRIAMYQEFVPVVNEPRVAAPGTSFTDDQYVVVDIYSRVETVVRIGNRSRMHLWGECFFRVGAPHREQKTSSATRVGGPHGIQHSERINLDPRHLSVEHQGEGVEWASVPLLNKIYYRRQYIADPKGEKNTTPLGLDLDHDQWDEHITREEPITFRIPNSLVYRHWLIGGGSGVALFKRER